MEVREILGSFTPCLFILYVTTNFRKETSRLEVLMEVNIFLDQLNRPLQLSQNNVTSNALAFLRVSACVPTKNSV